MGNQAATNRCILRLEVEAQPCNAVKVRGIDADKLEDTPIIAVLMQKVLTFLAPKEKLQPLGGPHALPAVFSIQEGQDSFDVVIATRTPDCQGGWARFQKEDQREDRYLHWHNYADMRNFVPVRRQPGLCTGIHGTHASRERLARVRQRTFPK